MTICPKCNSQNISVRFIPSSSFSNGEWMEYRCCRCGFEQKERPNDYDYQEYKWGEE